MNECGPKVKVFYYLIQVFPKKNKNKFLPYLCGMENNEQLTEAMELLMFSFHKLHKACRKTYENDTTQRIGGIKAALMRGDCGVSRLTKGLALMIANAATEENKAEAMRVMELYLDVVRIECRQIIEAVK